MTMPPSQEDSALPITGGPGAELRRAREAKGIERARISLQLHLSDATIEALERDDYQHMPGIVFARGYVRKYARLLNLDENALVAQFNQVCPEHVEPLHLTQTTFNEPTRTSYRPARGRRGLLPIAGMLVLLLLIGAGIALWMRVDDAPQPAAIEAPTDNSNLLDRLEPTTPPAEGPQE